MSDLQESRIGETAEERGRSRGAGLFGKRREFLIDRRYQLKASLLTVTVALILLVFLNLALHSATLSSRARILEDAPALEPIIRAQDRVELSLVLLASFVFLVGVFVVGVLESHKTAGAAHQVAQRLAEIRDGRYGGRVRLRKGDNLQALEEAFNRMSTALAERTWNDIERLNDLAERAAGPDGAELTETLHQLAADARSRVER
jgi:hypothetical protein